VELSLKKCTAFLVSYPVNIWTVGGYPGETKERFLRSLAYLKKLRDLGSSVDVCVNNAQPYPGTRLTARCYKEGIIKDKDLGNFLVKKELMSTGHFVPITTVDFDSSEVMRRREQIVNMFIPKWKVSLKKALPLEAIAYIRNFRRYF